MSDVEVRTSDSHEIYVDFLPGESVRSGRLGMTMAPGMKADTTHGEWRWERDLSADMEKLKELKTDVLVSVMEEHEYRSYEIPDLYERDEVEGIEILRFPIEDMNIPREAEAEEYQTLIGDIVKLLGDGKTVVVHCRGGLGHTGTVAACVLVALGRHSAKEAISVVRAARKGTVQTTEQEDFVRRFEQAIRERGAGIP